MFPSLRRVAGVDVVATGGAVKTRISGKQVPPDREAAQLRALGDPSC
jgi:hypothetical protein